MSNRLTFSLASLILIFGLVFTTALVMADDDTANPLHTHPTVKVASAADNDLPGKVNIAYTDVDHDNVTQTADRKQANVTLMFTVNTVAALQGAYDESSDVAGSLTIYDSEGSVITTVVNDADASLNMAVTDPDDDNDATTSPVGASKTFYSTITFTKGPTFTDEVGYIGVTIPASGFLGARRIDPDTNQIDRNNGKPNNAQSEILLTVATPDTQAPTLVIDHTPADGMKVAADNTVTFMFKFSEALGTNGFAVADDLTVGANGTAGTLTGPTDGTGTDAGKKIYMLPVVLTDVYMDVKVTVAAMSVNDISNNDLAAAVSETYTAPTPMPPPVPTAVTAIPDATTDTVTISWTAPANVSPSITGYTIIQSQTGAPSATYTVPATATSFTTGKLAVGMYMFTVAAENSAGLGTASAAITAEIGAPPGMPTGLTATVQAGNLIMLSWTAPTNTGSSTATIPSYTITQTGPANATYTATTTTFTTPTAPALASGMYSFTVKATNSSGKTGPASAAATATIRAFTQPVGKQPLLPIGTVRDSIGPIELGSRFQNPVIPAHGWAVLVRDETASRIYAPQGSSWIRSVSTSLPDLALFFGGRDGINSGTLSLHAPPGTTAAPIAHPGADAIVISEIMWGVDNANTVDPTCSQWIEFYNTTTAPIDLTGWSIRFHRSLVDETTWNNIPHLVDIASNAGVTDRFPVHKYHHPWAPKGQSGTWGHASTAANIVSMFLEINYTQAPNVKHAVPSGADEKQWSASVYPQSNLPFGIVGTPGSATEIRINYADTKISQAFILNEFGNSNDDGYDWVEIYNPSADAKDFKGVKLTEVYQDGSLGKERILFTFPDTKIPGKSYVVFAATDPKNDGNDLAAGIDVARSDADQTNKGLGSHVGIGPQPNNTTAFYRISSGLKLPNEDRQRLYILRSNDKIGSDPDAQANVIDVVGSAAITLRNRTPAGWTGAVVTDRGLTSTDAAHVRRIFNTSMWPIQWGHNPHGERVDGGAPNLATGKVYQRNGTGLPNAKNHLTTRGYTGIGYDRHAPINAENGGTPGYSNGALKSKRSELAGMVSISEIMLATDESAETGRLPRATRLPQWIEIFNGSMTQAVNIKNWYLEIQSADDPDLDPRRPLYNRLRLTARDVIIQPNQTILIVSGSGINSGHFPDQRVINLYTTAAYRNELRLQRRGDQVFSKVGFYLELQDHEGSIVDTIGNLARSRRIGQDPLRGDNFDTFWDLPTFYAEDGHRTSMIRVYDKAPDAPRSGLGKIGEPGDKDASWMLASDVNFRHVPSLTYYGNHRDYGTPGYRGGGPLPVSLSKFRPERLDSGDVVIRWSTESELNNAGFNILRSDTRDGQFTQINTSLIAGQGTTSEKTNYEWKDATAKPNVVYYYQIQDVSLDGQVQTLRQSRLKGYLTPAGKLTTTWGDLKALQ